MLLFHAFVLVIWSLVLACDLVLVIWNFLNVRAVPPWRDKREHPYNRMDHLTFNLQFTTIS